MDHEHIDTEHLEVTGRRPSGASAAAVTFEDDVTIVITQAFGPTGENLVGLSGVCFDGFPALTVLVRSATGREGLVHLSPIHGDMRKSGFDDMKAGEKCELFCPVSKQPLERVSSMIEGDAMQAEYFALYLTNKLDRGSTIYISDVWGHHHSRIVDDNELISHWASTSTG